MRTSKTFIYKRTIAPNEEVGDENYEKNLDMRLNFEEVKLQGELQDTNKPQPKSIWTAMIENDNGSPLFASTSSVKGKKPSKFKDSQPDKTKKSKKPVKAKSKDTKIEPNIDKGISHKKKKYSGAGKVSNPSSFTYCTLNLPETTSNESNSASTLQYPLPRPFTDSGFGTNSPSGDSTFGMDTPLLKTPTDKSLSLSPPPNQETPQPKVSHKRNGVPSFMSESDWHLINALFGPEEQLETSTQSVQSSPLKSPPRSLTPAPLPDQTTDSIIAKQTPESLHTMSISEQGLQNPISETEISTHHIQTHPTSASSHALGSKAFHMSHSTSRKQNNELISEFNIPELSQQLTSLPEHIPHKENMLSVPLQSLSRLPNSISDQNANNKETKVSTSSQSLSSSSNLMLSPLTGPENASESMNKKVQSKLSASSISFNTPEKAKALKTLKSGTESASKTSSSATKPSESEQNSQSTDAKVSTEPTPFLSISGSLMITPFELNDQVQCDNQTMELSLVSATGSLMLDFSTESETQTSSGSGLPELNLQISPSLEKSSTGKKRDFSLLKTIMGQNSIFDSSNKATGHPQPRSTPGSFPIHSLLKSKTNSAGKQCSIESSSTRPAPDLFLLSPILEIKSYLGTPRESIQNSSLMSVKRALNFNSISESEKNYSNIKTSIESSSKMSIQSDQFHAPSMPASSKHKIESLSCTSNSSSILLNPQLKSVSPSPTVRPQNKSLLKKNLPKTLPHVAVGNKDLIATTVMRPTSPSSSADSRLALKKNLVKSSKYRRGHLINDSKIIKASSSTSTESIPRDIPLKNLKYNKAGTATSQAGTAAACSSTTQNVKESVIDILHDPKITEILNRPLSVDERVSKKVNCSTNIAETIPLISKSTISNSTSVDSAQKILDILDQPNSLAESESHLSNGATSTKISSYTKLLDSLSFLTKQSSVIYPRPKPTSLNTQFKASIPKASASDTSTSKNLKSKALMSEASTSKASTSKTLASETSISKTLTSKASMFKASTSKATTSQASTSKASTSKASTSKASTSKASISTASATEALTSVASTSKTSTPSVKENSKGTKNGVSRISEKAKPKVQEEESEKADDFLLPLLKKYKMKYIKNPPSLRMIRSEDNIRQKINGWKIHHVGEQIQDTLRQEQKMTDKLRETVKQIEELSDNSDDLAPLKELLEANVKASTLTCNKLQEANSKLMNYLDKNKSRVNTLLDQILKN